MTATRQKLASLAEVAEYLGVAKQTLYNWRARRTGPRSTRTGGRVRYRWSDVDAWVESQST